MTVEEALGELARMFPGGLVSIMASRYEGKDTWTVAGPVVFKGDSLEEAMREARLWKENKST